MYSRRLSITYNILILDHLHRGSLQSVQRLPWLKAEMSFREMRIVRLVREKNTWHEHCSGWAPTHPRVSLRSKAARFVFREFRRWNIIKTLSVKVWPETWHQSGPGRWSCCCSLLKCCLTSGGSATENVIMTVMVGQIGQICLLWQLWWLWKTCNAAGESAMTSAACFRARLALCSPSAAITFHGK